jgi:hypothetical protein
VHTRFGMQQGYSSLVPPRGLVHPPVTFTHSNSNGTAFPALSDYLHDTADKELERLARGETRRAKKGEGER